MCKLAPVRVSYQVRQCDFVPCLHVIPRLHQGTLNVGWRDCDANLDWMLNTTHALPVTDSRENYYMQERTVIPRLHDTGVSFPTGMKISLRYSDRGEFAPI